MQRFRVKNLAIAILVVSACHSGHGSDVQETASAFRDAVLAHRFSITSSHLAPESDESWFVVENHLATTSKEAMVNAALALLEDSSENVRRAAVETLIDLEGYQAIPNDKVRRLFDDSSPEICLSAVRISAENVKNRDLIEGVIRNSEHPYRNKAIASLVPFLLASDTSAQRTILRLLQEEGSSEIVGAAFWTLREIGMTAAFSEKTLMSLIRDQRRCPLYPYSTWTDDRSVGVLSLKSLQKLANLSGKAVSELRKFCKEHQVRPTQTVTEREFELWGEVAITLLVTTNDPEPIRTFLERTTLTDASRFPNSWYYIKAAINACSYSIIGWDRRTEIANILLSTPIRRKYREEWIVAEMCSVVAPGLLQQRIKDYLQDFDLLKNSSYNFVCFDEVVRIMQKDGMLTTWEAQKIISIVLAKPFDHSVLRTFKTEIASNKASSQRLRLILASCVTRTDLERQWKDVLIDSLR